MDRVLGNQYIYIDDSQFTPTIVTAFFELPDEEYKAIKSFVDGSRIAIRFGSTSATVHSEDIDTISRGSTPNTYKISTKYSAGESINLDLKNKTYDVIYR